MQKQELVMYKIYSRPRIKILKFKNPKAKKMTTLLVILIIASFTAKFMLDAVFPIFDNLCANRAESIATIVSNEQATVVMKEHSYDELYSIEKDNEGNITMIKSNIVSINEITSDVANKIQNELNQKGKENVEIAMRKLYRI